MSFGNEIRKARLDKGMKQKDFIQALGLGEWYVGAIERDTADPPFSVMQQIAALLDLSLDALPMVAQSSGRLRRLTKKALERRTEAAEREASTPAAAPTKRPDRHTPR